MKVVIAIDHNPNSQAIIDAVVKMHWYEGTELHLVTVIPAGTTAEEPEEAAELEQIENVALELRNALTHCKIFFFAREGDPKKVILDLAHELKAELIIVGSNCKNTLERLLIGSVSQAVIHEAGCPVIVAKAPCSLARDPSPAFKTILIPVDNSAFSDAAIAWLSNFTWTPKTTFVIAAIVEENTDPFDVDQSLAKRAADLRQRLKTDNVVTESVIGRCSEAIVDLAKSHYADLIVLGTHGRTGIKKLILGEVAEDVSHTAPCALAIVGGVGHDESWVRTEAFAKFRPVHETFSHNNSLEHDSSVGVIPGGF